MSDTSLSSPVMAEESSASAHDPPMQQSDEVNNQRPAGDAKTASIKLYLNNPLRFTVERHNELESPKARDEKIFQDFEAKLKRYGLSRDELYWIDGMSGEHRKIKDDADLGELTHDAPVAHLYTTQAGIRSSEGRQKKGKKCHDCFGEHPHSVRFMLYRNSTPQFSVTFKDKDELFKKFNEKLKELGVPFENLYYIDYENNKANPLRNADDVLNLTGGFVVELHSKEAAEAFVSLGDSYHLPSAEDFTDVKDYAGHLQTRKEDAPKRSRRSPARRHRSELAHAARRCYPPRCSIDPRLASCPFCEYANYSCAMCPCVYSCNCGHVEYGRGKGCAH